MNEREQAMFDLLASLVEWNARNGVSDDPIWSFAERQCNRLRDSGAERTSYLDDYYEIYRRGFDYD